MEPTTQVEEQTLEESSIGIDPKLAGLLTYILGPITGVIFLIFEKKSSFVRFHAMQSTVTFLGLWIGSFVIGLIPVIGWLIAFLLSILALVLWILLMVKAFQGERYKLPMVGDIAEERSRS